LAEPFLASPSKVEVIDPLAWPWTVRLTRKRGRRGVTRRSRQRAPSSMRATAAKAVATAPDLETKLQRGNELDLDGATAISSYLSARPPHLARPRGTRYARGIGTSRHKVAILMLALLAVAGLALTGVIVELVKAGVDWSSGQAAATIPLVEPAPVLAGGLPQRDEPVHNSRTLRLIGTFTHRFAAVSGSGAGQPAAFYRELGSIDLASNGPGWVMYLGHNSAASLGAPAATIGRVMAVLTGSSAPGSSWPVAAGPPGGSARCAIAPFGSTIVSLCAWATEHTIGALMSPRADTKGDQLALLMPMMRVDLQPGPASHQGPKWKFG